MRGSAYGGTIPVLALLVISLTSGCGESVKDTIANHKAAIEAKLAALKALEAKLADIPPVETSALTVDGPAPDFFTPTSHHNAVIMQAGQLADLTRQVDLPLNMYMGRYVMRCGGLVRTGLWPAGKGSDDYAPRDSEDVLEEFAKLERTRYALVIRIHELELPSLNEDSGKIAEDDDAEDKQPDGVFPKMEFTFQSGHVAGDALLFDLTDGKHLGGVVFDVRNSPHLDGRAVDLEGSIVSDLQKNVYEAIKAEFQELVPEADF